MSVIKIKRGLQANVPSSGLNPGEFLFAKDTGNLYISQTSTQKILLANVAQLLEYLKKSENLADLPSKETARQNLGVYSKVEVDNLLAGLSWKDPVKALSTSNITLSGSKMVDGILVNTGDRVLVTGQTDPKKNGIYRVNTSDWVRSEDANSSLELRNLAVFVGEGVQFADTAWVCTSDDISLGTTDINFVQFAGSSGYSAGLGLVLNGNEFALELDELPLVTNMSDKDYLVFHDLDDPVNKYKRITLWEAIQALGIVSDEFTVKADATDDSPGFLVDKIAGYNGIALQVVGHKLRAFLDVTSTQSVSQAILDANADTEALLWSHSSVNKKTSINKVLKGATIDGGTF